MPLQSSGSISLGDMHAFFGLGYGFNSYRGRGSVPASGAISFSQMYGATLRDPSSGHNISYSGAQSGNPGVWSLTSYGVYLSSGTTGTSSGYKWAGSQIMSTSGSPPASYSSGGWTYYKSSLVYSWAWSQGGSNPQNGNYYIYGIYRIK